MPELPDLSQYIPYIWHWTTIMHYLLLIGTIFLLFASGDDTSMIYLIVVAALAIIIAFSLFISRLPLSTKEIGRLTIFLLRVGMMGIPALIAGLGRNDAVRAGGLIMAVGLALPLVAITILTCPLGPGIGDPRLTNWCTLVQP